MVSNTAKETQEMYVWDHKIKHPKLQSVPGHFAWVTNWLSPQILANSISIINREGGGTLTRYPLSNQLYMHGQPSCVSIIFQLQEESPARRAGLEPFFDFILSIGNTRLVSELLWCYDVHWRLACALTINGPTCILRRAHCVLVGGLVMLQFYETHLSCFSRIKKVTCWKIF